MGWFNERDTLVVCDLSDCKHIKKHKRWGANPKSAGDDAFSDVCGAKYISLYNDRKPTSEGKIESRFYCGSYAPTVKANFVKE